MNDEVFSRTNVYYNEINIIFIKMSAVFSVSLSNVNTCIAIINISV